MTILFPFQPWRTPFVRIHLQQHNSNQTTPQSAHQNPNFLSNNAVIYNKKFTFMCKQHIAHIRVRYTATSGLTAPFRLDCLYSLALSYKLFYKTYEESRME